MNYWKPLPKCNFSALVMFYTSEAYLCRTIAETTTSIYESVGSPFCVHATYPPAISVTPVKPYIREIKVKFPSDQFEADLSINGGDESSYVKLKLICKAKATKERCFLSSCSEKFINSKKYTISFSFTMNYIYYFHQIMNNPLKFLLVISS